MIYDLRYTIYEFFQMRKLLDELYIQTKPMQCALKEMTDLLNARSSYNPVGQTNRFFRVRAVAN